MSKRRSEAFEQTVGQRPVRCDGTAGWVKSLEPSKRREFLEDVREYMARRRAGTPVCSVPKFIPYLREAYGYPYRADAALMRWAEATFPVKPGAKA